MIERSGAFVFGGQPVTLVGPELGPGDAAPAFHAIANDRSIFQFEPGGRVTIISSVPSLDTGVCDAQTRRFNQEAAGLPAVEVVTVSADLFTAQKRWCGAAGIDRVTVVSDARDMDFAPKYGTYVKEWRLCSRAVFVVGKDGKIAYAQYVPDAGQEPEYAPVLEAARAAAER